MKNIILSAVVSAIAFFSGAAELGKIPKTVPVYTQGEVDAKFAGKADKADVIALEPIQFAHYYPDGSVTSVTELTSGIKYTFDTTNRTASVKPFCDTDTADNDNSSLVGRVVIPPYVDEHGNPYVADDGTRFKVTALSGDDAQGENTKLTAIVAPTSVVDIGYGGAFDDCKALVSVTFPSVTNVGYRAFYSCTALVSVKIPNATDIGGEAFTHCRSLASVSFHAATSVGNYAFNGCTSLASVSLPAATNIGNSAFATCTSLTSVDFGDTPRSSVPTLGSSAFAGVPNTCKIIVPDSQYAAWTSASGWSALVTAGYKFLRHSEWEYARRYEVATKADATLTPMYSDTPTFSEWSFNPATDIYGHPYVAAENGVEYILAANGEVVAVTESYSNATMVSWVIDTITITTATRTRTDILGYTLGSQNDKPLASEAEVEALRTNKVDKISNPTNNNFVAMDANGGLVNSNRKAGDFVLRNAYPVSVGLNSSTSANSAVAVGGGASAGSENSIAVGHLASASGKQAVAIGSSDAAAQKTSATADYSIAIGPRAATTAASAVQIGPGTNNVAQTLKFRDYTVVGTGGKIPNDRLYLDTDVEQGSPNPVSGGAVYDTLEQVLFAKYYPDGSVKSAAEFRSDIKYNLNTANRTAWVKQFCNTGTSANDNSGLVGRVVIPPFVDGDGNGYISDDGTRFKVVVVSGGSPVAENNNLTAVIAPNTVTTIGADAFYDCIGLTSVTIPDSVTTIENYAFYNCRGLTRVTIPSTVTIIGDGAFGGCRGLTNVTIGKGVTSIGQWAFSSCTSLTSVDFGYTPLSSVPSLGSETFFDVTNTCKIIVPDSQYDDWIAATDGWEAIKLGASPSALSTRGSLAYAYANGNYTVNGIEFSAASGSSGIDNENCSVNIANSAGNVPPSDVESGGYKNLLSHGWWASAGSRTVTLRNLTEGHNYLVQIVLSSSDYQTQTATSPDGTAVAKFGGAGWEYGSVLSGVFTATGSTETLSITYSGGSWINGIQVRDLGSSVPGHNYWHDLYVAGYDFLRHSEWEYARRYELKTVLSNQSMPAAPTQNELAEAVKKIFRALGGTILNNAE